MRTDKAPTALVRKAIHDLVDKDGLVTIEAVAYELVLYGEERRSLAFRFTHLCALGEIELVGDAMYRLIKSKKIKVGVSGVARVWSILRSRRLVSYADIMELANIGTIKMAYKIMWMFRRNGYVRPIVKNRETRFQLIKNVPVCPKFDAKGNEVKHETYK